MVLLYIFLQIVYITRKEINKLFTCPMLYSHHMANILKNLRMPIVLIDTDRKAVLK
jgi:hypothetical protein